MQDISRLDNWRQRYAAEMDRQRQLPFRWGTHDCFLGMVTGAVDALTGADLGRGFRGRYKSERKAAAVLAEDGFASLADLMASLLPEIPPAFARVGDVGVLKSEGEDVGEALCLVDASGVIVMTAEGHGRRPREDMIRAFKVG